MKSREEILERLRSLQDDLQTRRYYGGPDPDPRGTSAVEAEVAILTWVLSKETP